LNGQYGKTLAAISISAVHAEAWAEALRSLLDEFGTDLLSLIVGGSVGRGVSHATSDLDLFVLIKHPWSQRRRRMIGQIEIDLFIDPPARIQSLIESRGNPVIIENYATGWIAWDPETVAAPLARKAARIHAEARNELSAEAALSLRVRARDFLHAVESAIEGGNKDSAQYLLSCLVVHCASAYYEVNRLWISTPKARMANLASRDPVFAGLMSDVLCGVLPLEERARAARALALRLVGDLLFQSEWNAQKIPFQDGTPVLED
jgi:hypothetical protein